MSAFDYSVLDPEIADDARQVAERVRGLARRHVGEVIGLGMELARIKKSLGHGRFGPWLKAEFGGTDRTARNYLAAATWFATKTEVVSSLPMATVYKLASNSVPSEAREVVLSRLEAGDRLSEHEIGEIIGSARAARRGGQEPAAGPLPGDIPLLPNVAEESRNGEAEHKVEEPDLHERAAAEFISRHLGEKLPELIRILTPARPSKLFLALQEIADAKSATKRERKPEELTEQLALLL
ncbi:MAG TPA: hypothetical protein VL418_06945 [Devosiaceae bacterium]|nr:hypothetical protein [Devosiaceae bacterium]